MEGVVCEECGKAGVVCEKLVAVQTGVFVTMRLGHDIKVDLPGADSDPERSRSDAKG